MPRRPGAPGALAQVKGVDAFFVEISNFGGDGS